MQSLEVSGAIRPIYGSLGVKRLTCMRGLYMQTLFADGLSFSGLAKIPNLVYNDGRPEILPFIDFR